MTENEKKKEKEYYLHGISPSGVELKNLFVQYQTRQYEDAERLAISITQEFPTHQFSWKVLGAVLGQTGRKTKAVNAYQKAVELSPQDAEVQSNLGVALQELGRFEESEVSLAQAIALKPDYAEAYYNLGITLQELGRLNKANESYKKAIALKPNFFKAHNNLGNTLQELGRLEEAEQSFHRALALKPDYPDAQYNLGITFQKLGRLNEAKACYVQAIILKPDYTEAHRNLTSIKRFDSYDEQYLKMQELYLDKHISEEQRCNINFSLAKACEDLGNFEKAFKHYKEGNMLRKNLLNYDINQDVKLFKKFKASYVKIEKNTIEIDALTHNPIPIFIVGMPRSGTTLVEQIISSHTKVTGAGELPFVAQFGTSIATDSSIIDTNSLHQFREKYFIEFQSIANGNLIVTDKMPQNFQYLGLLSATFPEAKIIHVKRNPAAVCWANYKQYFASKNIKYCYALDDIIKYYELYKNLMGFWKQKLQNRIYDVDYELLTVNQEDETRKLINHIGLEWDEKCLSPQDNVRSVATASNMQVRQKVYLSSSKKWRKYKPFLNGALNYLDELSEQ